MPIKTIGPDRTYIDYWQSVHIVQRRPKRNLGIRVRNGYCSAVIKAGAEQPDIFGDAYQIPIELETLPSFSFVRLIIEDHLLNYPNSDLMDVLAAKKSFEEALDFPTKIEGKRERANPEQRLSKAS